MKQRYNTPVHRAKSGRAFRQSKPRKSRPKDAHNRFKTIRRDSFVPQDESASKRLTRVFWLKWVRASARYNCRRYAARGKPKAMHCPSRKRPCLSQIRKAEKQKRRTSGISTGYGKAGRRVCCLTYRLSTVRIRTAPGRFSDHSDCLRTINCSAQHGWNPNIRHCDGIPSRGVIS